MAFRFGVVSVSIAVHGVALLALGSIREKKAVEATAISVVDTPKPKEKPPEPAKVEPPPEPKTPKVARRAPAPAPVPEAVNPPPAAPTTASLASAPDFGLELSGGGSTGGLAVAVPAAGAARPAPTKTVTKSLSSAKPELVSDACAEEGPFKPKLVTPPQPAYTDAARAAGVEGKVRVQIDVDETGAVVAVRVLAGLGYGLDEAAIAAAKAAVFQPAQRCGKPVRSTFTVSMRFQA